MSDDRDDPEAGDAAGDDGDPGLAAAIGAQIRDYRRQLKMTVAEVAAQAELSAGMLSKIERGKALPSLPALDAIARALNVPFTSLLARYEKRRACTYIPAGKGLPIERRGSRSGHEYFLLGQSLGGAVQVEPYLVVLNDKSEVFPIFEHPGLEFLYLLEGEVIYRYWNRTFHLRPGDSLFFESDAPHGPAELLKVPIRMLSLMCRSRE